MSDSIEYSIRVTGPDADVVHSSYLYTCEVTVKTASAPMSVKKRFGLRHFAFVDHGPFKLNGERLLLRGTCRHQDLGRFRGSGPRRAHSARNFSP